MLAARPAAAPARAVRRDGVLEPGVVTGKDGKARVTFRAPMALSEYRFTARGVTGSDTLVGQTTADLTVRKDFFVDLKVPASLTQGDKPRFVARCTTSASTGRSRSRSRPTPATASRSIPKTIDVKGDGVDEVLFDAVRGPRRRHRPAHAAAELGEAKDELVVEVPVRPWGVQAFASASGTASDDATVFVGLPRAGRTRTPRCSSSSRPRSGGS